MWKRTENSLKVSCDSGAQSPSRPAAGCLPFLTFASDARAAHCVGCRIKHVRVSPDFRGFLQGTRHCVWWRSHHSVAVPERRWEKSPADTGSIGCPPCCAGKAGDRQVQRPSAALVLPSAGVARAGLPPGAARWGAALLAASTETRKHNPAPTSGQGCGAKCQAGEPGSSGGRRVGSWMGPCLAASQIQGGPCDSGQGTEGCGLALN